MKRYKVEPGKYKIEIGDIGTIAESLPILKSGGFLLLCM
jgi:hypothetical protein